MHLCFGTFSMSLMENRKNNAVSKAVVGRALLDFIDSDYTLGKEDRYIYYFMDQQRELPKELKFKITNIPELRERFAQFIDRYMSPDHESLLSDMILLVKNDAILPDNTKKRLLQLSQELRLPDLMAELFVFTVDSTNNKTGGAKPRVSRKRFNLFKEINGTGNNKTLCTLARIAIQEQDIKSLTSCLAKITNNVYMARVLVALSQDTNFAGHPEYIEIFHSAFSSITNNKYRYEVFADCLHSEYFKERPEQLLEPHVREYTNNRYAYATLIMLCELGLRDYAEQYRGILTNKVYTKRLDTYFSEH